MLQITFPFLSFLLGFGGFVLYCALRIFGKPVVWLWLHQSPFSSHKLLLVLGILVLPPHGENSQGHDPDLDLGLGLGQDPAPGRGQGIGPGHIVAAGQGQEVEAGLTLEILATHFM